MVRAAFTVALCLLLLGWAIVPTSRRQQAIHHDAASTLSVTASTPSPRPTVPPPPPPTPTPPPATPAPTPPPPAPSGSIQQQVVAAWPGSDGTAAALVRIIGRCENPEWNTHAVSPTGDYGISQINRPTWESTFTRLFGVPWEPHIYDVRLNVAMAYHIYSAAGKSWSPWTCAWAA